MKAQQRVFFGEIGEITISAPLTAEPLLGVDIDAIDDLHVLFNLCLACGIDVRDIIGVQTCDKHVGWVLLADKELPEGYNLVEHCVYCKSCWTFYRLKRI
jgi:hypothetical protein